MTDNIPPEVQLPRKRGPIRRVGCTIAVILWFLLLLTPCVVIVLATRGEISISTGDAPEQRVRLWLVMEARSRGLGISNASLHESGGKLCVQTDVQFLLWQGSEDSTQYCDCYTRDGEDFNFVSTNSGTCIP